MKNDEKLVVAIEADTSGFDKAMTQVTASSKAFGDAFSASLSQSIIKGRNFEDTLRSIGARLSQVALNNAIKPVEDIVSNIIGSLVAGAASAPAFAKGGAFGQAGPVPFAKGGVVASPAYFNFAGGTGVMGEAGAEAILPLSRGPDGKLGVAGGASQKPSLNVVFNVNATDAASFRRSESQISAMLSRAVSRGNRNL